MHATSSRAFKLGQVRQACTDIPTCLQDKKGRQNASKAKREARLAVLGQAQVVGCTLSAAGGELASLLGNALHFDGLIIDEVLASLSALPGYQNVSSFI